MIGRLRSVDESGILLDCWWKEHFYFVSSLA